MTGVLEIMDALAKSLCEGLPKLNAIYTDLAPVDFGAPKRTDSECDERIPAGVLKDGGDHFLFHHYALRQYG